MCHTFMSFWDEKEANILFEKPRIKHVKNIDLLHELPFYDELSILKILQAFEKCARRYKIEIIDSKDPLAQLKASKSSIEDLFKDLLDEMKGFKYQTTVKANTKTMDTWNLLLFILILLLEQLLILNMILINLFKKFCTGLIIGLMKDLVG